MKYLVSACLMGINCKYNGESNYSKEVEELVYSGKAIPVCPEVLGGLPIPRVSAEMVIDGNQVLVINKEGKDVTKEFTLGAQKTLEIAKAAGVDTAIFQKRSPSCGVYQIYDGTFSGSLIDGSGITARLLRKNNIRVITVDDLDNKMK